MHKACKICLQIKPIEAFTGLQCNECKAAKQRQRVKDKPEYYRSIELQARYGISLPDYYKLLAEQDYKCAVCGSATPGLARYKHFCVDHDHATGYVRGLLCNGCNKGLGYFRDNPTNLKRAHKYLQSPPARKRWKK